MTLLLPQSVARFCAPADGWADPPPVRWRQTNDGGPVFKPAHLGALGQGGVKRKLARPLVVQVQMHIRKRKAQAWQVISERDQNAKLVILGHGPAADTYRNLMPQAIYVGAQSGQDLPVHYASADVLLFPSVTETYGNVVPEAMASGLMGLTFDYAASSALVLHDHNGWVAPFADKNHYLALAAELSLLPDHRLAVMRQAAAQSMQSHGWDAISVKIEQLWREQLPKHVPHGASALSAGVALPQA